MATLFAGVAAYAFALAVITFRFLAADGTLQLGKNSPFDQALVTFISNLQASVATLVLMGVALTLAFLLRSEILLPVGIVLVSTANALQAKLPHLTTVGDMPVFRNQIAFSLSPPDGWLFRLPPEDVLWGCAAAFCVGLIACTVVSGCVRT